MPAKRPNILLMLPHDLGDTLRCYGYPGVPSPRLDRLAEQGVRFAQCFTPSPECTASRGCLMTGRYPHQNGLMGLLPFGWSLQARHLADYLREAGYATHLFGMQHETHDPAGAGYQTIHPGASRRSRDVCGQLTDFLQTSAARHDGPWFAFAGFQDVHRPWGKLPTSETPPVELPPWLPDHPVVRRDMARFHQAIDELDQSVGMVLDTLADKGLEEETLVIFTSDHGSPFPGAKATFYDPGIRVPLIMRWRGRIEGGHVHDDLISNLDVLPTLLELAGVEAPDELAGHSFLPLLDAAAGAWEPREEVHGALHYDVAYDPMRYVRTKRYKYIRSFAATPEDAAGADPVVLTSFAGGRWARCDDQDVLTSPTWQALAPPGGAPPPPPEELYDLQEDPWERHNLADDPAAASVLREFRERLRREMVASGSPLLDGHVPANDKQREATRKHSPGTPEFQRHVNLRQELM